MRGYDDTPMLRDMAEGMFSRKYGSVDEAARAVTGEDGGSNVDRLRRKFRTDGWFEKGLNDYVEATIKERGLVAPGMTSRVVYVDSLFWSKCREWSRIVFGTLNALTTQYDKDRQRGLGFLEQAGRRLLFVAPLIAMFIVGLLGWGLFGEAMTGGWSRVLAVLKRDSVDIIQACTVPLLCWLGGERLTKVRWNTVYREVKASRTDAIQPIRR